MSSKLSEFSSQNEPLDRFFSSVTCPSLQYYMYFFFQHGDKVGSIIRDGSFGWSTTHWICSRVLVRVLKSSDLVV